MLLLTTDPVFKTIKSSQKYNLIIGESASFIENQMKLSLIRSGLRIYFTYPSHVIARYTHAKPTLNQHYAHAKPKLNPC